MRRALFGLAAVMVFAESIETASACTTGIVRSYFSYERPSVTGASVRLLVNIPRGGLGGRGTIRARVLSGVPGPSDNGFVIIQLPEAAFGTNCVELGPTEGSIFVVGALRRNGRGELILMAEARLTPRPLFVLRSRLRPSDYDQYILDPALRSDAPSQAPPH